jgi:hypothetical protein
MLLVISGAVIAALATWIIRRRRGGRIPTAEQIQSDFR